MLKKYQKIYKKIFLKVVGIRQEIFGICVGFMPDIQQMKNCDNLSQKFLGDKIYLSLQR